MSGRIGAALALLAAPPVVAAQPLQAPATSPASEDIVLDGTAVQGALVRGRVPPGSAELRLDGQPVPVAPDGAFVIGFDRDRTGPAVLSVRRPDGRRVERILPVTPRDWAIEHIDAARRPAGPTDAFLRIREGELARIAAARALDSGSAGWRQTFVWPARGRISGVFGSQRIYRGEPASFHSGIDVAAGAGAQVVAPADGVVVLAGPPAFSLEGNLVIVDHGMGLNSAFLHLATTRVQVGQAVRQGDPIGTVGATGRATGPHLHWSVKWRDARIDPAPVARGPAR